jgi:phosphoglycolate phosphatase
MRAMDRSRPTSPLRLAVFDCDGTLVDSQHSIFAAVSAAFEAVGLARPAPEAARRVIGLPLDEALKRLVPAATLPSIDTAKLTQRYKDAFFELRTQPDFDEPLFPGAAQALDALAAEGYLLGIATGKSRRGLDRTLERHGLLDRFVTIQTNDSGPGKPHPHMLERALAETGADAARGIMIGDTVFDMAMARSAGFHALGVAWGYHGTDELLGAGAHALAERFEDVPPSVERLVPARTSAP